MSTGLLWLGVSGAAAWFWHSSLRAREHANAMAADTCAQAGLQFLDGTVALQGLRPQRGASGRLTWRRSYAFDYSRDGVGRHQGFIIMLGNRVEAVGLASDREH